MRVRGIGVASPIPRFSDVSGGLLLGDIRRYPTDPGAGFLRCNGSPFSPSKLPALVAATPRVLGVKGAGQPLQGYSVSAYAYGKGLFVAVGALNSIATSPDGINWTYRASPFSTSDNYNCVAFADGKFVAGCGSTGIAVSSDGITWTAVVPPATGTLWGVAYGNGTWVICKSGGQVLTSTDAINWTNRSVGVTTTILYGIAFGNGIFACAGGSSNSDSPIITSNNGISWAVASNRPASQWWRHVSFWDGKFFIPSRTSANLYTTQDMVTFTQIGGSFFGGYIPNNIAYTDGLYIFSAESGRLFASVDNLASVIDYTSTASAGGQNSCVGSFPGDGTIVFGCGSFSFVASRYATPTIGDGVLPNGQQAIAYMKAA